MSESAEADYEANKRTVSTDSPNIKTCTYQQTKTSYSKQPFYRCRKCFSASNQGVCAACAESCHSGHGCEYAGMWNAFCDCGLKSCSIKCSIGNKCTFDLYGKTGKSQQWYRCRTCWGEDPSFFGCCEMCAQECHKGHDTVKVGQSSPNTICDCGDNKHQAEVCTYHVTAKSYQRQPFYGCRSCFNDQSTLAPGCCYQCMKVCHAGHPTYYRGVMRAFCDCGLDCCKITCKIAKPK